MKKIKTKKECAQPSNESENIFELIKKSVELSLKKRGAYSTDAWQELSAQLAFTIFNLLTEREIFELPFYIRTCARNLVISHMAKFSLRQEVATDPIDMVLLDTRIDSTVLDSLIRDEYLDIRTNQLEFIRSEIGDKDYLMLEAHFRDGESYKTIAAKMGIEKHIVANHINRARAKCQKLKNEGYIDY